VFPVVLLDANIYDPVRRLEYVKHWEMKRVELGQAMKEVDPTNLQGIREDMDLYDRIRDKIPGLTSILKDMNTLTPDMHKYSDFSVIYAGEESHLIFIPQFVSHSLTQRASQSEVRSASDPHIHPYT
jgi:hypothetical protein